MPGGFAYDRIARAFFRIILTRLRCEHGRLGSWVMEHGIEPGRCETHIRDIGSELRHTAPVQGMAAVVDVPFLAVPLALVGLADTSDTATKPLLRECGARSL
jgi:hypothetical protein